MSEQAVNETVANYIASVNAKNPKGISIACHFPHFRVMGNNVVHYWKSADDLWNFFLDHVAKDGWAYSELKTVTLEKFTDQKYHASVEFNRYQSGGTLIGNYKSLYITIFKENRWGIAGGSGNG